jgi:2,4-dienoyl-CoA reductase-like NADH-dependent reductase (Old Yellow Enzyme family)
MPALSDRFSLRGRQLRNRLVMAPMVTGFAEDHLSTDAQVAWYREHARRGLGLVVVESTGVLPDGIIMQRLLGLWDDAQIPSLARIASAIKEEGVPAILQLVHGGARSVRADLAVERIGASALPLLPGPAPRPMTQEEIRGVIAAFAAAAARAVAAGFDGVEIHAAHYYLISQFLSPLTNRLEAPWGGSLENRSRLGVEVVKAVRAAIGPDPLIFCRMHSVENLEGGLSTEEACRFAQAMEAAGVDVINASGIGTSSWGEWQGQPFLNTSSVAPKGAPGGGFAPSAHELRAAVGIPVVTVGKLGDSALAQGILDRGDADLIALARPLIADFAAAEKLLEGRDADLNLCKECLSCFASIRKGPIRCSVNKEL